MANARGYSWIWRLIGLVSLAYSSQLWAGIHTAPIIVPGKKIQDVTRFPLSYYRLFRSGKNGEAIAIPFQIDETNEWGDFILNQGPNPNTKEGNQIFDPQDELVFMGDDVGPVKYPTKWPEGPKPYITYEIKFTNSKPLPTGSNEGAVYLAVYITTPPPLVQQKYVIFDPAQGRVTTSRYQYDFDKKNYLVLNNVDMFQQEQRIPIIDSSTFFVRADMKYFLTLMANHRSINSRLDAFKVGPVRTMVRITFFYTVLKLNFEVGMYTEVSFFTNSVILPTIIYNPVNGKASLNKGSGFFYGFALFENPDTYEIDTNMRPYKEEQTLLGLFAPKPKTESKYWLSALGKDRMLYMEIKPSEKMIRDDNIPKLYKRPVTAKEFAGINNDDILPLEKSPVNVALYFDLTKFDKGDHNMSFQLFFDNKRDLRELSVYKNLSDWEYTVTRL